MYVYIIEVIVFNHSSFLWNILKYRKVQRLLWLFHTQGWHVAVCASLGVLLHFLPPRMSSLLNVECILSIHVSILHVCVHVNTNLVLFCMFIHYIYIADFFSCFWVLYMIIFVWTLVLLCIVCSIGGYLMFVVGLYFYFLLPNEWYHKTLFGAFSKYVSLAASGMRHAVHCLGVWCVC